MKHYLLLYFSFLFFLTFASAQNKADVIKNIRQEYQRINGMSLSKFSLDAEDYSENTPDGGAELVGYYKKDSLLKITEWIGLSYGNQQREYYLKNGQLFFVFERFDAFVETDNGLDHSKVKKVFEGRYYFNNKKLVDKLIKGKKPIESDTDPSGQLLIDAETNIKVLNSKRKK